LAHLGLPTEPPPLPRARDPAQRAFGFEEAPPRQRARPGGMRWDEGARRRDEADRALLLLCPRTSGVMLRGVGQRRTGTNRSPRATPRATAILVGPSGGASLVGEPTPKSRTRSAPTPLLQDLRHYQGLEGSLQ